MKMWVRASQPDPPGALQPESLLRGRPAHRPGDCAGPALCQPGIGQGLPPGMGATTSQASLGEAGVISQGQCYRGGCRCEELAAPGGWAHRPSEGDLGGTLTAPATGSFSHLEESAFHVGGLTHRQMPSHGEFGQPGGANLLPRNVLCHLRLYKTIHLSFCTLPLMKLSSL